MANNQNKEYEKHSFKSFLTKYKIVIPKVQRDYAQGRNSKEAKRVRERFLDAIKNKLQGEEGIPMKLDFVYGEKSKVWSKTEPNKIDYIIITPLDGQQRLTTLYLLHWYAQTQQELPESEYSFLNNFTYDIRPSSRDFCAQLVKFVPTTTDKLSQQIKDQIWFQGEWHNDPTILSMLVMLDSIQIKFSGVEKLWEKLTGESSRIIFYFLPLSENGLSDALYIKMNSRGKKLTDFEHFKAEYESLYEADSTESLTINHKFDVEWTDMLFDYRNESTDTTDEEWMRYFFYLSHILCYKQLKDKPTEELKLISTDEFKLIDELYRNSPHAEENRQFIENAFDCWCKVKTEYKTIDNFFATYLSETYEKGHLATYRNKYWGYNNNQNYFTACIRYYNPGSTTNYGFSYGDFLFLYGIITYLIYKDKVTEEEFRLRLRILRNLIYNSTSGEIRRDQEYMQDHLAATERLILKGDIIVEDLNLKHKFNKSQIEEEQEKQEKIKEMNSDEIENLYEFEDHPLLHGFISGIGYGNLDLKENFYKIFTDDAKYLLIHQAMTAIGDYRQEDGTRYYMCNQNSSTWDSMLHAKNRNGFDKTMSVLIELLNENKKGKTLEEIIEEYIQNPDTKKDWRYYFAKYSDMIRGSNGELSCEGEYGWITLNRHQFNGQHWNSFLNVIYKKINECITDEDKKLVLENYGDNLLIDKDSSLSSESEKYLYYNKDQCEPWMIEQNAEGIDIVDRVELAVNNIKSKLKITD